MKNGFRALVFVAVAAWLIFAARAYNGKLDTQAVQEANQSQIQAQQQHMEKIASLQIKDLVLGTGAEAKNGNTIKVHYVGTFEDGKVFESSYDAKNPIEFVLGQGNVIEGWDLALLGMRVGGKRQFTVPPELGYGAQEKGPIPPNSTLKFTVELVDVQ